MVLALIGKALTAVFGSRNERLVASYAKIADQIEACEPQVSALAPPELLAKTAEFKARLAKGDDLEAILPEALACVREASKRAKAHRHFHCQLVGGQVLFRGNIAEMKTGEGKTIVCHLAAYLKVITGHKVHIVTVNDYLVKRDAEFAKPIFELLGVTVNFIQSQVDPGGYQGLRQQAYHADITYGTNNEFGFDYLRDNMKMNPAEQCQQGLDYAVIDEVDSILIDEARTPLIISGPAHDEPARYKKADEIARRLLELQAICNRDTRQRIETREPLYELAFRIGQVSKARVDQACDKFQVDAAWLNEDEASWLAHKQYFVTERERKQSHLTHDGVTAAQEAAGIGSFYVAGNMEWPHLIENSLRAHVVYELDKDYVVQKTKETPEGEVIIVDEFTGRLMIGRQWSDGLHQAVEAKERVKVKEETQTMATITLQNYFKLYANIAGMTGTAQTEADEFMKVYKLEVITIPTNKPMIRLDSNDKIYGTTQEKFDAVVDEIESYHRLGFSRNPFHLIDYLQAESRRLAKSSEPGATSRVQEIKALVRKIEKEQVKASEAAEFYQRIMQDRIGPRPILVGTTSVEKSEALSKALTKRYNLVHEILNAKNHAREAEIVAKAGQQYEDRAGHKFGNVTISTNMAGRGTDIVLGPGVARLGGLHVVGTERHEARRIDNQLRGRSGRQGDPGSTRFFVSLEDDLMRLFAGEWTIKMLKALGLRDGMSIEDKRISRGIARAQKKVEERNFLIRKNLLDYDEVMDFQRRAFYSGRQRILCGEGIAQIIQEIVKDTVERAIQVYLVNDYATAGKVEFARSKFSITLDPKDIAQLDLDTLDDLIRTRAEDEAKNAISITIGEYLVEGEDPATWDYRGLATWAMQQFQVNLSITEMRQMQPPQIEEKLIAAAIDQIDEMELPELEKYFDPDYALSSFVEYLHTKFGFTLTMDEFRGQPPEAIEEKIMARLNQEYHKREEEYPIDFACSFAFSTEQVNAYQAQWFISWVNAKYDAGWTLDTLNGRRLSEVREEVQKLHRAWSDGRLTSEVDAVLAKKQGPELTEWAAKRFGRAPKTEGDLREQLLSLGKERLREELTTCERFVLLNIYDQTWKDHLLGMDHLRNAIGLRSYAERDPRVEYKKEGFRMFNEMWDNIREKVTDMVLKVRLTPDVQVQSVYRPTALEKADSTNAGFGASASAISSATGEVQAQMAKDRESAMAAQTTGKDDAPRVETIRREKPILRRNDACPCGSGKKFKKCCGDVGATPKIDLGKYEIK